MFSGLLGPVSSQTSETVDTSKHRCEGDVVLVMVQWITCRFVDHQLEGSFSSLTA